MLVVLCLLLIVFDLLCDCSFVCLVFAFRRLAGCACTADFQTITGRYECVSYNWEETQTTKLTSASTDLKPVSFATTITAATSATALTATSHINRSVPSQKQTNEQRKTIKQTTIRF